MRFLFVKFRYYWFQAVLKKENEESARFKSKGIVLFLAWIYGFLGFMGLDILTGVHILSRLHLEKVGYFQRIWMPTIIIMFFWGVLRWFSGKYKSLGKILHPYIPEFEEYVAGNKTLSGRDVFKARIIVAISFGVPIIVMLVGLIFLLFIIKK